MVITILLFGLLLITMFAIAYGQNQTNSTSEMLYGDNWNCGYIKYSTNQTLNKEIMKRCIGNQGE